MVSSREKRDETRRDETSRVSSRLVTLSREIYLMRSLVFKEPKLPAQRRKITLFLYKYKKYINQILYAVLG